MEYAYLNLNKNLSNYCCMYHMPSVYYISASWIPLVQKVHTFDFFPFFLRVSSSSLNTGVTFSCCKGFGKVPYLYSFWFSLVALSLFFLVLFRSINFKKDYFYVAIYMQDFVNPFTTNVPHHIETIQLICNTNQLTGFYMIGNIGR